MTDFLHGFFWTLGGAAAVVVIVVGAVALIIGGAMAAGLVVGVADLRRKRADLQRQAREAVDRAHGR